MATVRATNCNVKDIYRAEADSFLKAIPDSMQIRQADAVYKAIGGDYGALASVRMSRNVQPELPKGVSCNLVTGNMVLFRCDRYYNDTIPLLVYFHGGGWTIGSINSCTRFCAAMAINGVAVLAVDYRLAPEHPYPEGLTDCVDAVKCAADSLDVWRCAGISLGGDSSGGNLAIATAMSFPEGTFDSLIAFYPVTKAYRDNSSSWNEYGDGFGLDNRLMDAFNSAYTKDPHKPLISPADTPDTWLKKLPPTLLIAAERDILKDQGLEFAERLRSLGKEVRYDMIPGSVHLFITVPGQNKAFSHAVSAASEFLSHNSGTTYVQR